MVDMKDVAARAGVSLGTVSNVLNSRPSVAPEYIERVNRAIDELGFVRNEAARALRSGTSRVIGLLIPEGQNPYFNEIARGAEAEAQASDHIVTVGTTYWEPRRERFYLEALTEQRVRGVIVAPSADIHSELERLRSQGTPSVVLATVGARWDASSLVVDNQFGGMLVARHLLELGRRRLAFVGGPMTLQHIRQRRDGVLHEARSFSVEVIETVLPVADEGWAVGEILARRAPAERPDAVVAVNDLVALGLMNALIANGVAVPSEVSLVGYDDIDLARTAIVPLTSVRHSQVDMGAIAVQMIEQERAGAAPSHRTTQPQLVVRQSAARVR